VKCTGCTKRNIFGLERWSILETNTKWFQALDTVGGEPTVAGQFGRYILLINGWKIKPYQVVFHKYNW
jgi:hypothetical protein